MSSIENDPSEAATKTLGLLKTIDSEAEHATRLILQLRDKIENSRQSLKGEGDSGNDHEDDMEEEGIGLLHLKNLQMSEYLSNLVYLALRKTHGKSISGEPAIDRIVEQRTVLEKIRPMEKKLKYQVDKYIRLADHAEASENDPLHFKPNLANLDVDEDDGSEDSDGQDEDDSDGGHGKPSKDGNKKYVAPKHVPALCPDDDSTRADLEAEAGAKAKKAKLSKAIVEDLKRQYLDTPEEEFNHADHMRAKQLADMRERIRYEEDNYMRLPALSKKEKHKQRKSGMTTVATVGKELTYFGSHNFFNQSQEGGADGGTPGGRKRKSGGGGKKGSAKKKFKKRM